MCDNANVTKPSMTAQVKICDLGLAKKKEQYKSKSSAQKEYVPIGTPGYQSPEVLRMINNEETERINSGDHFTTRRRLRPRSPLASPRAWKRTCCC